MTEPGKEPQLGGSENGRDASGRFGPGNAGGPGGPRRRASELRRAAEEAVSPEHVQAMIRKALRMGLEGNLTAMRLVFERTCGRAAEAPVENAPVPVAMPLLRTAADCDVAIDRVVAGIVNGTVDRLAAKLLLDAIQVRLKSIDSKELEQRLAELENITDAVEHGRGRRRRL